MLRLTKEGAFGYKSKNEDFNKQVIKKWDAMRPKYDNFRDIYTSGQIERNKLKVRELKGSVEYEPVRAKRATEAEYIVMSGIHDYLWFGEGVSVVPTNEYDDFVNKIDLALSFFDRETKKNLYLGIDVTTAEDPSVMHKKFNDIALNLKNGKLSQVRYFMPDNPKNDSKGKKEMLRVVVKLKDSEIDDLVEKFAQLKTKKIEQNPIRLKILEQIDKQISEAFLYLASWSGTPPDYKDRKDIQQYLEILRKKIKEINK